MTGLVPSDLFPELVDGLLERSHGQLAYVFVFAGVVAQFFVTLFKPGELGPRVGEFDIVRKAHGITSIMPFGTPIRSVPKMT